MPKLTGCGWADAGEWFGGYGHAEQKTNPLATMAWLYGPSAGGGGEESLSKGTPRARPQIVHPIRPMSRPTISFMISVVPP